MSALPEIAACPYCGGKPYTNPGRFVLVRCGCQATGPVEDGRDKAIAEWNRVARLVGGKDHPEDYCHRCGGRNVSWFTASSLWNKHAGDADILCPLCFVEAAVEGGAQATGWELVPENHSQAVYEELDRARADLEKSRVAQAVSSPAMPDAALSDLVRAAREIVAEKLPSKLIEIGTSKFLLAQAVVDLASKLSAASAREREASVAMGNAIVFFTSSGFCDEQTPRGAQVRMILERLVAARRALEGGGA